MDMLDTVIREWADDSKELSISALYNLSGLEKDDVERVRGAWPSIAPERRHAIMRHLVDICEANFEVDFSAIFHIGLKDESADVRVDAIDGLWEDLDVGLMKQLIGIMQDDADERVRSVAAGSLGRFVLAGELEEIPEAKAGVAVESLLDVIHSDEPMEVRRRALEAVSYSGDTRVPPLIEQAYAEPNERWRVSAVFAMGRSADARWVEAVLRETESLSPEIRFEAARASGELQLRKALPILMRMVREDEDDQVREIAVWSLGQIGGEAARKVLEQILDDEDSDLYDAAEAALDELVMMGSSDMLLFDFDLSDGAEAEDDTDGDMDLDD
jgi:HEAT repeat protein